jgi:hypothetical protein
MEGIPYSLCTFRKCQITPAVLQTSAKNIFVRAEWLLQSGRAPSEPSVTPGGGLLRAQRQYDAMRYVSPSDCRFAISFRSVDLLY